MGTGAGATQRRFAVAPDVLVWARKSAHLAIDEAARRIGVSEERVDQWERGDVPPTINQLRHAADAYNRPLAALFMPTPLVDEHLLELPDFRRPESVGNETAALQRAILRAQRQQEAVREVRDELGDTAFPTLLGIDIEQSDAENAGADLRRHLGLDDLPKGIWSRPELLLRELVRRVEGRGYLVVQVQRVAVSEMRGFSIAADVAPLIAINGADWPRGKVFTLMHELAHVSLRQSSLCDLSRQSPVPLERFCDQVAAAALMPAQLFHAAVRSLRPEPTSYVDLRALSDRFGVSAEAGLIRMVHLGLASWEDYSSLREDFRSAYAQHKQDEKDARGGRDAPIYYQLKVRDLGRPFILSMLRAHNEGVLSSRDTARLLDVSYDKIPKLVERVNSAEALA